MKPTSDLVDKALAVAREVAQSAYGPAVEVRFEGSSDDWHRTLHRHIFEQQMSLWNAIAYLDLITDRTGQVIGYIDHEAYRRADDQSVLGDEDVRGIVMDNEFLPPGCRVVGRMTYPGPEGGRLEAATVEGPPRSGGQRWLVEINIARRVVASIRPLDADERGEG